MAKRKTFFFLLLKKYIICKIHLHQALSENKIQYVIRLTI